MRMRLSLAHCNCKKTNQIKCVSKALVKYVGNDITVNSIIDFNKVNTLVLRCSSIILR